MTGLKSVPWSAGGLGGVVLAALVLVLGGCQTSAPPPTDAEAAAALNRVVPPRPASKADTPEKTDSLGPESVATPSTKLGDDLVLPSRPAPPENPVPKDYSIVDDLLTEAMRKGTIKDPDAPEAVSLNLEDMGDQNIEAVIKLILEPMGFQYWLDPQVTGAVALRLPKASPRAALKLLEQVLWLQGAYLTRREQFIHILPFSKMPQERLLLTRHEPIPNVAVELVRLNYTAPSVIVALLTPFITPGATVTPVPNLNALLFIESPENMPKLREFISQLDRLGQTKWPMVSARTRHIPVETVIDELNVLLPTLGYPIADPKGEVPGVRLVALKRLQVLVASAPTSDVLEEIQRWVQLLDQEDLGEQERVFFYPVRYSKAEDLSDALGAFFNVARQTTARAPSSSQGSTTASGTPTAREPGEREAPRFTAPPAATTQTASRAGAAQPQRGLLPAFEVAVSLFVDGKHNRLVIRTSPRAYALIEAFLARLDQPPLQALIQVTIAEIQLTRDTDLGFNYAALGHLKGGRYDIISSLKPYGTVLEANPQFSLTFQKSASPEDAFAFVQAVAGKNNTHVLFSPQIIAISDMKASIKVGDRVPIVSREQGTDETATPGTVTRDIQYQDTGIILTVTPHITNRKMVTLDIRQEVSDAVKTTITSIDSPTIQSRTLETSLLVEDGTTVMLGGMISTRKVASNTGFPLLKDIPGLGYLFGRNSDSDKRQELLLLMTVNVIDRESDQQAAMRRYRQAIQAVSDELQSDQPGAAKP